MQPLKIGIQLASLRMPFKQALLTAARLGAQAVEIDARHMLKPAEVSNTGLRHLRKILEESNLRVCAVGFPTRRGYNVQQDLDRRVEATKETMSFAYRLGAKVVVNHVGNVPEPNSGPEWDLMVAVLNDLGRFGQHIGATLAAETGAEDGERLAQLIAHLEPGALGVNFDPGNLIVNNFSPREAIEHLAPHVIQVHATDGVRDRAQGRGLHTLLGRGSADFPELVARLEEEHFAGYYTVERAEATDAVLEVSQAVEYLRHMME